MNLQPPPPFPPQFPFTFRPDNRLVWIEKPAPMH